MSNENNSLSEDVFEVCLNRILDMTNNNELTSACELIKSLCQIAIGTNNIDSFLLAEESTFKINKASTIVNDDEELLLYPPHYIAFTYQPDHEHNEKIMAFKNEITKCLLSNGLKRKIIPEIISIISQYAKQDYKDTEESQIREDVISIKR
jgi:hypothetical protein